MGFLWVRLNLYSLVWGLNLGLWGVACVRLVLRLAAVRLATVRLCDVGCLPTSLEVHDNPKPCFVVRPLPCSVVEAISFSALSGSGLTAVSVSELEVLRV